MTAVRRVVLIRHAGTAATRHARFPADEDLAPAGTIAARNLPTRVPHFAAAACSDTLRARRTAAAAGWPVTVDDRLAPLDVGRWAGHDLQHIGARDPGGLARWMTDPAARPHDGETVLELITRVRGLLQEWHDPSAADRVAVTHGSVIRAAVVVALDAPAAAFWRIEAAPASATELHTRGPGWVLFAANTTT